MRAELGLALALAIYLGDGSPARAACDAIPASNPLSSATRIDIADGLTVNGNPVSDGVTGADSVVESDGTRSTVPQSLPSLEPSEFPPNDSNVDVDDSDGPFFSTTVVRYGKVEIRRNEISAFSGGGPFHIDELKMEEDATLDLAAGIYYVRTLDLKRRARIDVTSGPVLLHVGEKFEIDDDVVVDGGSVDGLRVLLHSGAKFDDGANGRRLQFTGFLYGPDSGKVGIGVDSQLRGALIVSDEITIKQDVTLTYTAADAASLVAVSSCQDPICATLPLTNALASGREIDVKNSVTMNGYPVASGSTGPDSLVETDGSRGTGALSRPDLVPSSFPANSSTTDASEADSPFVAMSDVYYDRVEISASATASFSGGGPFHIDELEVEDDATLVLGAGTYYVRKLELKDRARIDVSGAPVAIHVGEEVDFKGTDVVVNGGGGVSGLILFMHDGARLKKTGDRIDFTGIVFGPNSDRIEIGNDATWRGPISTWGAIEVEDGASLFYDASDLAGAGAVDACLTRGLDHFLLAHDGYGIHCLPESIELTPIDSFGDVFTGYGGTVVLDTQTGTGSWTGTTGSGALTDATPGDGLATYAFAGTEVFPVSFTLDYPTGPAALDIDLFESTDPALRDDDSEGPIQFGPSGFTVTASALPNPPPDPINDPIPAQTAGISFPFHLSAYGQTPTDPECGIIESYTGARGLRFWSSYWDPAAGSVTPTIDGMAIASNEAGAAPQPVTFDDGRASVLGKYKDVGRISIQMKDDTVAEPVAGIRGGSNGFVVRPADFVITRVERPDTTPNPGGAIPTGPVFVAAGTPFRVAVDVLDAEGDPTPNYGNESASEGILLVSASLTAPAGGRNGTLDDGSIGNGSAFSATGGGSFLGTSFYFDEVGAILLRASVADGSYLGTGDLSGALSGTVGRFTPDHFDVSPNMPELATACPAGGFTYQGEPFTYTLGREPVLAVTARNAQNTTTANYAAAWFRITQASLTGLSLASLTGTLVPPAPNAPSVNDLGAGLSTLVFDNGPDLAFQRGAPAPTFDAEISLEVNVIDEDGVAYGGNPARFGAAAPGAGIAWSAGQEMRYGRLVLGNAHGSELTPLPVPLRTQVFDGLSFVPHVGDGCTSLPVADLSLAPDPISLVTAPSLANVPVLAGDAGLTLSAPGIGGTGFVDLLFDLGPAGGADMPWLQYDWDGDALYDDDPTSRATFGIYPGDDQIIHLREIY